MKRDLDLVRYILLMIEQEGGNLRPWIDIEVEGRSRAEIAYHIKLLHEAALIEAVNRAHVPSDEDDERPRHLTWAGHEFLDLARHETLWEAAKERAEQGGVYNFDILKSLLDECAREMLELSATQRVPARNSMEA